MGEKKLAKAVGKLGIGEYQRHVLLCTGDSCCSDKVGQKAWDALKDEIKEQGLQKGDGACYRTKVGCLRVCERGPVAVVYPEGTWYSEITADRVPELVRRHLIGGEPVREWAFADNPLPADRVAEPEGVGDAAARVLPAGT